MTLGARLNVVITSIAALTAWAASNAIAQSTSPQPQCAELAKFRDGPLFSSIPWNDLERAARAYAAADQMIPELDDLLRQVASARRMNDSAIFAGATTHAILISVKSIEALVPVSPADLAQAGHRARRTYEVLEKLSDYLGKSEGRSRIADPRVYSLVSDLVKEGKSSQENWDGAKELGLAVAELVPVVGKWVPLFTEIQEAAKFGAMAAYSYADFDARSRQFRTALIKARSKKALAQKVLSRFRAVNEIRQRIDMNCGSGSAANRNSTAARPQQAPGRQSPMPLAPSGRNTSPECAVLQTAEGTRLAVNDPARYEDLLRRCPP